MIKDGRVKDIGICSQDWDRKNDKLIEGDRHCFLFFVFFKSKYFHAVDMQKISSQTVYVLKRGRAWVTKNMYICKNVLLIVVNNLVM